MKVVVLSSMCLLVGCSTISNHYDTMDSCQYTGKSNDYRLPDFCNHHRPIKNYVYDRNNRLIYIIK